MGEGFLSRLSGDGRAERVVNRLVSRAAQATPWGRALLARSICRIPLHPCRVLFVCKGNICRSAYAEVSARNRASTSDGWTFNSAGLDAEPGNPAPQDAVRVALELGLDLSAHRSRPLTSIDPATIDVVFVMEPTQALRGGLSLFRARSPILMLGALAGDPLIPDPFGRDPDIFRQCFATIDTAIDRLLERGSRDATRVTGLHRSAG